MFVFSRLFSFLMSLIFILTPQYKTVKQQMKDYSPSVVCDDVLEMVKDKDAEALKAYMSKGLIDNYEDVVAETQNILSFIPDDIDPETFICMDMSDSMKMTKIAKEGNRYAGAYFAISCFAEDTLYVILIGQQYVDTSAPDELGIRSIRLFMIENFLEFEADHAVDEDLSDDALYESIDEDFSVDEGIEFYRANDFISAVIEAAQNPLGEISAEPEFDGLYS